MATLTAHHLAVFNQYEKNIRRENINQLKEIKELLNTIFGEQHNQINQIPVNKTDDNDIPISNYMNSLQQRKDEKHYEIIVHFPEITIKNTARQTHTIKDLYIRWYMKGNLKFVLHSFSGMRTTFTRQEIEASYTHSHLLGLCYNFNTFCVGSGPILMIMTKLAAQYKSIDYKIFLHSINNYVRHESIAGTPYRYIRNIGVSQEMNDLYLLGGVPKNVFTQLYRFLLMNYNDLTYDMTDSQIKVTSTDAFEIKLAQYITDNYRIPAFKAAFGDEELSDLIVYKTGPNKYTSESPTNNDIPINRSPLITFKKEPKFLQINNGTTSISNDRYAHPAITGIVIDHFERLLTKTALTRSNAA